MNKLDITNEYEIENGNLFKVLGKEKFYEPTIGER